MSIKLLLASMSVAQLFVSKKNDDLSRGGSERILTVGATNQSSSPHVGGIQALESRNSRTALFSSGTRVDPGATEGRAEAGSIGGRDRTGGRLDIDAGRELLEGFLEAQSAGRGVCLDGDGGSDEGDKGGGEDCELHDWRLSVCRGEVEGDGRVKRLEGRKIGTRVVKKTEKV